MMRARSFPLQRVWLAVACALVVLMGRPSTAHAQCVSWLSNSCMSISYSPLNSTPTAADYANGVAVVGSFSVSVLKCGRTPCRVTVGAQGQPTGGLRLRVGGTAPVSITDCPIDVSGVSSPNSSNAPELLQTTSAVTVTVWVCRPLTWNPSTTPLGTTSTSVRFLLRQD